MPQVGLINLGVRPLGEIRNVLWPVIRANTVGCSGGWGGWKVFVLLADLSDIDQVKHDTLDKLLKSDW